MKPPARIRLRLLGRFALAAGDEPVPIRLSTRKAGALLAYLAMAPEQTASREELATLLWGSCSEQQARASLRQALVLLRKELSWSHFFIADAAVVRLQPGLWSVDAREFEDLSKASDGASLARAAALFGGEFLTGLNIEEEGFDEWVNLQRQRMQRAASRLSETCAARPDLVTEPESVLAFVERLTALDPLREDWQRHALTLYARYRGRNEALAQAEVFAATLQRELGVAPEKETRALLEAIRRGEIEPAPGKPPADGPAAPDQTGPAAEAAQPLLAPAPIRPAMRWAPSPLSGRMLAAGVALAAILFAGGLYAVTNRSLTPAELSDATARAAPQAERWRPPPLPSKAGAAPQMKGLTTIAVLPLAAQGETTVANADAVTDDLINMLSSAPGLRVISRQTMQSYRGRNDVAAIAAELDVRYVLEGTIRTDGDRQRVNVQLIDPATRSSAWSTRIDHSAGAGLAAMDQIVGRLARELQIEVPIAEAARASEEADVRSLNHKGWSAIYGSGQSTEALRQAERYFTQALARDPRSKRARIGLGSYHAIAAVLAIDADPRGHLVKAQDLLQSVIDEPPVNGGTYFSMGLVQEGFGNLKQAAEFYERAIELSPSHAASYAGLGHVLTSFGQAQRGLEQIHYAMRLSPRDVQRSHWLRFAAEAELELGQTRQALADIEQSNLLAPGRMPTLRSMAAILALVGRIEDARKALAEARASSPNLTDERLLARPLKLQAAQPQYIRGLRAALEPAPDADPWASPPPPTRHGDASEAAKRITPLLVLPFTTSGETAGATQPLADMVTDDLTNLLSRVASLRVISRQTALAFKGQSIDVTALGRELQVRYVLEGSMRMQDGGVRVNLELTDPMTRLPVWTTRIEHARAERSSVVDEIVGRLARELQVELIAIEAERRSKDSDTDALVARGWAALFNVSAEGYRQAEALFSAALERDPDSVRAQIGIGAYHARIGALALDDKSLWHRERARALLRDAIRRSPQSPQAHFYLALALKRGPTLPQALEEFERAVELNPSFPAAHVHIGHVLAQLGRPAEGIEHVRYGLRLSPRDPTLPVFLDMKGDVELALQRYDAAIEDFRRASVLNPAYPRPWAGLAAAHALAGRLDEAGFYVDKLKSFAPGMTAQELMERFGRGPGSAGREGLRLALAASADTAAALPVR